MQVGVVVISQASYLCYSGSRPGSRTGRLRFVDLNLVLKVFLPLQI